MPNHTRSILDLRKHRRLEDRRLVVVIILFLVVGGTAIGLVYGWGLVGSGVACLIGGSALFGLLWLLLSFIERLLKNE